MGTSTYSDIFKKAKKISFFKVISSSLHKPLHFISISSYAFNASKCLLTSTDLWRAHISTPIYWEYCWKTSQRWCSNDIFNQTKLFYTVTDYISFENESRNSNSTFPRNQPVYNRRHSHITTWECGWLTFNADVARMYPIIIKCSPITGRLYPLRGCTESNSTFFKQAANVRPIDRHEIPQFLLICSHRKQHSLNTRIRAWWEPTMSRISSVSFRLSSACLLRRDCFTESKGSSSL
jgi:hypothetical protein